MKSLSEIELELSKLGIRNRIWGKPEVKELEHILTDNETILQAANGRYQGGFALIVATDHRLLLIDKKMWFMSIEDVRFDMITELDFAARLLDATISVRTINKVLRFTSMNQRNLRALCKYLQERIMELRHMMMQQSQMPGQPMDQPVAYQANQFAAAPQFVQVQPSPQQPIDQSQPQYQAEQTYQFDAFAGPAQQTATQSVPTTFPGQGQMQPLATQQPYGTYINYHRPSRLRRMGSFPTASLTTQHQRFTTARR